MPTDHHGTLELGLAASGGLRWAVADVTGIVEEARKRLDLSPVAAAALGRSLAGAALLLRLAARPADAGRTALPGIDRSPVRMVSRLAAETPIRLVLEIKGDGPIGRVLAEADEEGNLRGMVGDPRVVVADRPDGKLGVGSAVGRGLLRVLREHAGGGSYHSQVELVSGEISEDLAHYLAQSEQTRSAVLLGVLGKPFGVAAAGGIIIEVLPGAAEETIARLEANIAGIRGVSHLVEQGGAGQVLSTLFAGLGHELAETRPLRYRCRCSRERLQRHLALLGADDRDHLRDERGEIVADCVFCATQYRFTPEELRKPSRL